MSEAKPSAEAKPRRVHRKKMEKKICPWCQKECLSPTTRTKVWLSWYHKACHAKYVRTLKDIEHLFEDLSGGPSQPSCKAGHVRTEENTAWYFNKTEGKSYPQCLECRKRRALEKKAARYNL